MGNLKQHRDNFLFKVEGLSPIVNINTNQPESETNITNIVTSNGETSLTPDVVRKFFPNFAIWTIPELQSYPGYPAVNNPQQPESYPGYPAAINTQQTAETINGEAPPERLEPRVITIPPVVPARSLSRSPSSPSEGDNGGTGTLKEILEINSDIISSALEIANSIIYREKGFSADKWNQIANATSEELNNFSSGDKAWFILIYRLAVQDRGGWTDIEDIEGLRNLRNRQ